MLCRFLAEISSSDGFWGEEGWVDARELYEAIWPDESIECPPGMEQDESDPEDEE